MLATTEKKVTGLYFVSEGFSPLTDQNWNDVILSATYQDCLTQVGICPRYLNDNFYLNAFVDNNGVETKFYIESFMRGITKRHVEIPVTISFPLTISCEVKGTYFVFSINNNIVHKMEFGSIPEAQAMLFAKTGETCVSASIKEPQATGWVTNGNNTDILIKQTELEDETQQITLKGNGTKSAIAYQDIPNLIGDYVLSFVAYGTGTAKLGDVSLAIAGANGERKSIKKNLAVTGSLRIEFSSASSLTIQEIQIEKGLYPTSYIPSTVDVGVRAESILQYPAANNFEAKEGTMFLSLLPKQAITSATLFATDTNEYTLKYASGKFTFTVKEQSVDVVMATWDAPVQILCGWENETITLSVNGTQAKKTVALTSRKTPKTLDFTRSNEIASLVIDDIIIWSERLPEASMDELLSPANIILHATFQKAIGGKGASWFELPMAPFDQSPILVEKQDGTNLRKVSFFDIETGKYRTYNEELFVYDGKSDFVEVAFADINEDFFDLMIRTEDGEKIGAPYRVEGKRIYFSLSYAEMKDLNRKPLYVRYQLNDSYTVDFNIQAVDGYRVDFAKHDGQPKKVYQEGNRWTEPYKLATMIEMNPLMNQNHEGFLYITNNKQETSSFKVTVTPEHLLADGGSSSLVMIEPVDKEGNFIGSANLDVTVKLGNIHRIATTEAAEVQKRSGIYLYRYYAPFISRSTTARNQEEFMWVIDKDAGIGIQYNFLLKPSATQHPVLFTSDRALAAERKAHVFNFLLLYEGIEEYQDPELFDILDLDDNGKVTFEDIAVLESGAFDEKILEIYTKIKTWEGKR